MESPPEELLVHTSPINLVFIVVCFVVLVLCGLNLCCFPRRRGFTRLELHAMEFFFKTGLADRPRCPGCERELSPLAHPHLKCGACESKTSNMNSLAVYK